MICPHLQVQLPCRSFSGLPREVHLRLDWWLDADPRYILCFKCTEFFSQRRAKLCVHIMQCNHACKEKKHGEQMSKCWQFVAGCPIEFDTDLDGPPVYSSALGTVFSWEECQKICRTKGHKYFTWAGTVGTNVQNKCYCRENYTSIAYNSITSGQASGCGGKNFQVGLLSKFVYNLGCCIIQLEQ